MAKWSLSVLAVAVIACDAADEPAGDVDDSGVVPGGDAGSTEDDAGPPPGPDETPPETSLVEAGPPAPTLPYARFDFVASEPAGFECSVDGGAFAACEPPVELPDAGYGSHRFAVRAIDLAGNVDPTPASHDWTAQPFVYDTLSQTGLYGEIAAGELAGDVIEYHPTYELWSDGAVKRRWIRLPPGATIDTADMDGWELPVGTQLWKEFRAPDGRLLETRLIERRSQGGSAGWEGKVWFGSFRWRADGSDADFVPQGATDVAGTGHDIPPAGDCWKCHMGQPGFALGFSAVQLSRGDLPGQVTLTSLARTGLLSDPPPPDVDYPVPGSGAAQASLGFLHANCGHCHNPGGWLGFISMDLLVRVEDGAVEDTAAFRTAVDVPLRRYFDNWVPPPGMTLRIASGDHAASAIWFRAGSRDAGTQPPGQRPHQMPPFFTEVAPAAVDSLAGWIDSL